MAGPFNLLAKFTLFRGKTKVRDERMRSYIVSNPHHAVSIQTAAGACKAAKACDAKRFLATEAPTLPLAACDATRCTCRYTHHDDRRSGLRRTADETYFHNHFWSGKERRREKGRRITDL